MGADWDPVTGIRGLAWPVTRKAGSVVDGRRIAAVRTVPTATQTVTDVDLYVNRVIGSGVYRCDVWKEADLPVALQTTTFRPNEDQVNVSWTRSAGTTNYSLVNESVLDTSNYLTAVPASSGALYFTLCVGSAGGLGAGAQVVASVEVHAVVGVILATTPTLGGVNFEAGISPGSASLISGAPQFVTPASGAVELTWTFATHPSTGVAWTEQDVIDLDDGASATRGIAIRQISPNGSGAAGDEARVYMMWAVVNYYNDTRLATADLTVTAAGWQTFNTADFTKTSAQNLVALISRVSGSGSLVVPSLDSGATAPSSPGAYRPTTDSAGNVTALGTLLTEAHPVIFPVAGAASIDSQPYATRNRSPVDTGHTVSQTFTADATDSRRWVQVVCGSTRHQNPAASLTVKIKKVSDNSQVGGTGTITVSRVADAPYPLQTVDVVLASAASLTSGTQYYVELTCTAAAGSGWDVAVLDAKAPPVTGYTAGCGGSTDKATVGGVASNDLDVVVVVGTVPTAPSGFTAT